jgi:hypothetical protein
VVGRHLWRYEFGKSFEEQTGKKFDGKEYLENPDYYYKNRDAIDAATNWAVRRTEELFNAKTSITGAQLKTFFAGTVKMDAKHFTTRLFDTLQSFNRNEVNQLKDAVRRFQSGDPVLQKMAIMDVTGVVTSNVTYQILRRTFGVATMLAGKALLQSIFDDAPELTEFEKKQAEELFLKKSFINDIWKAESGMLMGGSANIYTYMGRLAMFTIDKSEILNDEQKEEVYQAMENIFYSRKIPNYGSPETILKSTLPVPSPAIGDMFDTQEGLSDFVHALATVQQGGSITEKEVYQILAMINIGAKYGMPNIISPTIQRALNRKINALKTEERSGIGTNQGGYESVRKKSEPQSTDKSESTGGYESVRKKK